MLRVLTLAAAVAFASGAEAQGLGQSDQALAATNRSATLVIGRISSKPNEQHKMLDTLNRRIVAGMNDLGIVRSNVRIARDPAEMSRFLAEGAVDYLSETVFAALQLEHEGNAEILVREWKGGVAAYRTLIVVHKNSPISRLEDLAGRSIMFEDVGSTSGFGLPYTFLRAHGLNLQQAHPATGTADDALTYSFVGDETTVLARVVRGRADAGAVSDLEWLDETKTPATFKSQLRILATTDAVVRSVVMARRDLDPRIKERLADILEKLASSEDGRNTLHQYFNVARFDHFDKTANEQMAYARRAYVRYLASTPAARDTR